jgi:hypothetical protein
VDSAFVQIEEALGDGFQNPSDPIWQLPRSHQVWNRVRTLGLHLARNSSAQREVAEDVLEEARALRTMILDHLEAR